MATDYRFAPLSRRGAWTLAIAAGVVVLLLIWAVWSARTPQALDAAEEVSPVPRTVRTGTPVPRSTLPAAPSVSASAPPGVDEYQVCGGAWVRQVPDGSTEPDGFEAALRHDEVVRVTTTVLAADPRPAARAVALWLQVWEADTTVDVLAQAEARCGADESCVNAAAASAPAAGALAATTARDRLARVAAAASDPLAYQLALQACRHAAAVGAPRGDCALLSPQQWARLDSDNAAPWLLALADAEARRDTAAFDEALYRIAHARGSLQRPFAVSAMVLGAVPDDDRLRLGAVSLAAQAMSRQVLPLLASPLRRTCSAEALRDINRRTLCDGAASLLLERSDTFVEGTLGLQVGRQLGWPPDRLDLRPAQVAAYQRATPTPVGPQADYGCAALRTLAAELRRNDQVGETGVLRDWIASRGLQPQALLAEYRAARAQESAASAPAFAASAPR